MKWYFMLMGLLVTIVLSAQPHERLFSTAGTSVSNNGLVQMSVGEPVIGSVRSGDITLTQGFLQVFKASVNNRDHAAPESSFILFPNPSDGRLTLLNDLPEDLTYEVSVISLTGEKVFFTETKGTGTFDLSFLPAGIYFLQVMQDQKTNSIKFEKF